ncbi:MAG: permease [Polyangiaceae bacterium]|nr:permease [Polyangiaceae bacterium]
MLWALVVAAMAIGAGLAIGALPGPQRRLLGPIRSFGLAAAVSVAALHLLPHAHAAIGTGALLAFLLGLLAPVALERSLARAARGRPLRVGLELGFLGVLLHSIGDGVAMGTVSGGDHHAGHTHADTLVALAAHTVPVVAVLVLAFGGRKRLRGVTLRALLLFAATALGVVLATQSMPAWFEQAEGWASALVAGLLVHVVSHDLLADLPRSAGERGLDVAAALAGFLLPVFADTHHDEGPSAIARILDALLRLTVDTAPMLLLGLLAGALLSTFGHSIPTRWIRARGSLRDALRGAVVGLPLPLCSCGVLPVSEALRKRGAAPALVVAFLLATPELGVESFALSVRFLGMPFALLRLAGALLVAVAAAVVIARFARAAVASDAPPGSVHLAELPAGAPWFSRLMAAFSELLAHVGAWMVIGLFVAALVEALVPAGGISQKLHPLVEIASVAALSIPTYVCAAAATPLAAVLIAKGMTPGAVLVGLLLGPATNVATVLALRRAYGGRAVWIAGATVLGLTTGLALLANQWPALRALPQASVTGDTSASGVSLVLAALLVALLVHSVWRNGFRPWLALMASAASTEDDRHSHEHVHHGHGSALHDHAHGHGTTVAKSSD